MMERQEQLAFDMDAREAPDVGDCKYAAGFFDGEGCINLGAVGKTVKVVRAQMLLSNTDLPVLEWLRERWGGKIYVKRDKRELRPQWTWNLQERRLLPFLDDIAPFSKVKRPQVLNAQAFLRLKLQRRKHSLTTPEERAALMPFLKVHQDFELDKRPHHIRKASDGSK